MSDSEIRHLERYLTEHPDDYQVWHQYLVLGARQGQYDTKNFKSFISFVTKTQQPNNKDYDLDAPDPRRLQSERERYRFDQQEWDLAENRAISILHNIRNTVGKQWSPARIAAYFRQVLGELYNPETYGTTIVTCPSEEGKTPASDDPEITIEPFTIWYNESHQVIRRQAGMATRRVYWANEVKDVLDLTPQYILMVEIYHPGNRESPPDSDTVEVAVTSDPEELLRQYAWARENDANQEAYYDPSDEVDYGMLEEYERSGEAPRTLERQLNFAVDSLTRTFSNFRNAPIITRQEESIYLENDGQLIIWDFPANQVETLEGSEVFRSDTHAFDYIWRYWLRTRLESLLAKARASRRRNSRRFF